MPNIYRHHPDCVDVYGHADTPGTARDLCFMKEPWVPYGVDGRGSKFRLGIGKCLVLSVSKVKL